MSTESRIAAYVTNLDKPVYALRNLPPEVVAVLFAYVSRSPKSFRDNLEQLLSEGDLSTQMANRDTFQEEKASRFHEKWVVGYGHASVAEHASLHIAMEDVSILAAKVIEDTRLAAFTEKSSRYQVFDEGRFHWPAELEGHPLESRARQQVASLFSLYTELYHDLVARMEGEERPEGLSDRAWMQVLHAAACDEVRYLLPAGTLTSLGLTVNARTAAHLIRKLRAHPLAEMRQLGEQLHQEGEKVTPVLLKYSQPTDWQRDARYALKAEELPLGKGPELPRLRVLDTDPDAEVKIMADLRSLLLDEHLDEARRRAAAMSADERSKFFQQYFAEMGPWDLPPRALEKAELTIECCVDYGAYRDLQRHRILSPTLPDFGCRWGYELPDRLAVHARRDEVVQLLEESASLWRELASWNPAVASYFVPMAFRYRFLMRMNLRQAEHMIRLRSASAGHPSYRRVAQEMYREVTRHWPGLAPAFRVDLEDHAWAREKGEARK
jgi:thymidylate synthase ThyX